MNRVLVFWLAVLMLFGGGSVIWIAAKMQTNDRPVEMENVATVNQSDLIGKPIADFTLTERSGEPFDSQDMAGSVWVTSFFFASCPSTCRQQNELLRELHQEFADRGVKFVSITCDPENDTPEQLREYARMFTSDEQGWLFLTGDLETIEKAGKESFQLSIGPKTHSDRFVVADKRGNTRGIFDWHDKDQLAAMKQLLDELTQEDGDKPSDQVAGSNVKWINEFTLTERSGKPFQSQDLAGEVWVASFFFASCPSSCRAQNELISRLHAEFGPKGVTFVNISCDPETDTPERLREYARIFNADPEQWLFLTGDLTYIRRIGAEKFGVPVDKQAHVDRLLVVDRWGKVRGGFNWHDPLKVDELKATLTELLSETEPPASE